MCEYQKEMSSLSGKTILVVEDEFDLREILINELENQHAIVLSAESGREANQIFKTRAVDLVITDIRMAGGSGIELLDQIKTNTPEKTHVVMVTGFSDIPIEEVYDRGAANVFVKPFDLGKFVSAIEKLMTPFENRELSNEKKLPLAKKLFQFESLQSLEHSERFKLGRNGFFVAKAEGVFRVGDLLDFKLEFLSESELSFEGVAACRWSRFESNEVGPAGAGFEIIEVSKATLNAFKQLSQKMVGSAYIPKG